MPAAALAQPHREKERGDAQRDRGLADRAGGAAVSD
jgi:hypothetical protein